MSNERSERVTIETRDGWQLGGTCWEGRGGAGRSVVFAPALGAPQTYLRAVAGRLAELGWSVLTFDYRGVAASASPGERARRTIAADHWFGEDLPAAVSFSKRRTGARFTAVCAHSIGGQLFGMSPATGMVDGALLIAAQRGIPRLFHGAARLRVEYAYRAFPLYIRAARGELPAGGHAFPVACPGGPILQWIRWGREGIFHDSRGRVLEGRFSSYRGPLVAVTIDGDDDYAPAAAVEALTRLYTGAEIRRERVDLRALGGRPGHHFGLFAPRTAGLAVRAVAGWLGWLEQRSLAAHDAGDAG